MADETNTRPLEITPEVEAEWRKEERALGRRIGVPLIRKLFARLGVKAGSYRQEQCVLWWRANIDEPPPLAKGEHESSRDPNAPPAEEKYECTETEDAQTIHTISPHIRTMEDAVAHFEIDLDIWEPYKQTVKTWELGFKSKKKWTSDYIRDDEGSVVGIEGESESEASKIPLYQVIVYLRRKAPKIVTDAILELVEKRLQHIEPRAYPPLKEIAEPHLLVISLVDQHFGKLAWAPETGTDYDLKIAEKLFVAGVEDLLRKTSGFPIERIEFPIGHDFFHFDTAKGQTAHGTQMDVDSRHQKVYVAGTMAFVRAIDRAKIVAPVVARLVPGNHDPSWAHHLAVFLWGWYRNDERVTIDYAPMGRKYIEFGTNLILQTHGNMAQARLKQLPTQLAVAEPEMWGRTRCWEIHLGHFHHQKEIQFVPLEEFGGVMLRMLPSLCGTDEWHFTSGYVGNRRAALALLYSKTKGYAGQFPAFADQLLKMPD